MNFAVNAMGIAAPIVTGLIVKFTHSFAGAFLAAAAILVVGDPRVRPPAGQDRDHGGPGARDPAA